MSSLPRKTLIVLICGGLILTVSIGLRSTFGLFLKPMSESHGWGREIFAFAIALQNIVWGVLQPITGAMADRFGSGKILILGVIAYAAGLYAMSASTSTVGFVVTSSVLLGFALSATSFAVVLGAVGRATPEAQRANVLGIASSIGSLGQFAMLPIGQGLINYGGWVFALMVMAAMSFIMVPLAAGITGRVEQSTGTNTIAISMLDALKDASKHRGFILLFLGFFVCGFQVMFMATHLPAFIADSGFSATLGASALATVGMFNVLGSYVWGNISGRYSKSMTLAWLYILRAIFISLFMAVPLSTASVIIFSAAIGFTWLATVPVTTALVGQIFGMQYLSTLFGVVFFGHQIGSFLGVWLGGYVYDLTGNYDMVWYLTILLGVIAAALHWPINESPVDWAVAKESV